jgi:hypothetical protein
MPSEPERAVALLGSLRAQARVRGEALRRWAAACREPALRGGLRLLARRDGEHAALAAARLAALGASSAADADPGLAALFEVLGSPEASDRDKLARLVGNLPVPEPLGIARDAETRSLLETVADDERLAATWLRTVSAAAGAPEGECPGAQALAGLDALRAAQAAAGEVVETWLGVCASARLRGALRTVAARERAHARVLTERLRELGGTPEVVLDHGVRAAALDRFGARGIIDADKIALVLQRYPEPNAVARTFDPLLAELRDDAETRTLVELVAGGEAATIAWLRAHRR